MKLRVKATTVVDPLQNNMRWYKVWDGSEPFFIYQEILKRDWHLQVLASSPEDAIRRAEIIIANLPKK